MYFFDYKKARYTPSELKTSADPILYEVDVLMMPFQFSQADFYNAYKNARIIVDYKGGGKKEEMPAAV